VFTPFELTRSDYGIQLSSIGTAKLFDAEFSDVVAPGVFTFFPSGDINKQ
jgi:hypothetical protein